mmetsp:Transcript_87957/g.272400  ORF Transcript_87957/g.272400 Transcript_87957/m.272400 type:complete len:212 (-) Transcript_87957:116-751(-)
MPGPAVISPMASPCSLTASCIRCTRTGRAAGRISRRTSVRTMHLRGRSSGSTTSRTPANSQAAVGHLGRGSGVSDRLSVVMPIGAQPVGILDDYKSSIVALDAKTGEKEWEFAFPDYIDILVAGDRTRHEHGTLCLPNPYGSPSIDARGTVYTGHFNGYIYAIRDDNGDGVIQDSEVSKFDTGAGFSHGGAALAPGMLAIPSCDGLYVFKE